MYLKYNTFNYFAQLLTKFGVSSGGQMFIFLYMVLNSLQYIIMQIQKLNPPPPQTDILLFFGSFINCNIAFYNLISWKLILLSFEFERFHKQYNLQSPYHPDKYNNCLRHCSGLSFSSDFKQTDDFIRIISPLTDSTDPARGGRGVEEGGGLNLKVNELTTAIVGSNKSLSLGLQVRRVASPSPHRVRNQLRHETRHLYLLCELQKLLSPQPRVLPILVVSKRRTVELIAAALVSRVLYSFGLKRYRIYLLKFSD